MINNMRTFQLISFVLLLLTGASLSSQGVDSSYGAVSAPVGLSSVVVEHIQQAPSNPDVTCLRASVAVRIARQKLSAAQQSLVKC